MAETKSNEDLPEQAASAIEGDAKPDAPKEEVPEETASASSEGDAGAKPDAPKNVLPEGAAARVLGFDMPARDADEKLEAPTAQASPPPTREEVRERARVTAAREKDRPKAFDAIFDKAFAKLREAHEALKASIASAELTLNDARPHLKDARFERDRCVIKGDRALDGMVYLIVPMGRLEWRASFSRECTNYPTLQRNTDKRHPVMPQYGDTVIAYIHTGAVKDQPVFVEVDPVLVDDVEAWVEARVRDMTAAIMRHRSK